MNDNDPIALYRHVIEELNSRSLAYLHLIEARASGMSRTDTMRLEMANNAQTFSSGSTAPVISTGGYSPATGAAALAAGFASAIGFGRLFISNPDLVARIRSKSPLSPWDRTTFYGGGAHGYTDYPAFATT